MKKEKTLGDVIFGTINLDNGELNEPVHMDPEPDFCPYCGGVPEDDLYGGFCSQSCADLFYEENKDETDWILREEKRARN